MFGFNSPWLTEDEILFHRMETFHRERVEAIAVGNSPLGKRKNGLLVVHLIPIACVKSRLRIDSVALKEKGTSLRPLGSQGGQSRFNAQGVLYFDGYELYRAYLQLFRDGRMESAMSDISYEVRPDFPGSGEQTSRTNPRRLRDSICEQAMFETVSGYLRLCKTLELSCPVFLFSAILDCEGVRICTDRSFGDLSEYGIDRSPVYLPEIEITSFDEQIKSVLRPWCDTFWQSFGMERSFNFDDSGTWRERR
jgi:hypothetical protein